MPTTCIHPAVRSRAWLLLGFALLVNGLVGDQVHALSVPTSPNPPHLVSNVTARIDLQWLPTTVNPLLNGSFEAGLTPDWTTNALDTLVFESIPRGTRSIPTLHGARSVGFSSARFAGTASLTQFAPLPAVPAGGALWLDLATFLRSTPSSGFAGEFRVEIRAPDDRLLAVPIRTREFGGLQVAWKRLRADLTEFQGQTVRVSCVADVGANLGGGYAIAFDDLRIVPSPERLTVYEVYLGSSPELGPADLLGTTPHLHWPLRDLRPSTRYYWQIVTLEGTERLPGPVWSFATGPRGRVATTLALEAPAGTWTVGEPLTLTLTALDEYGQTNTVGNGVAALAAAAPDLRPPSLVVTELRAGHSNAVEFMNVGTQPVLLTGWQVEIFSANLLPPARPSRRVLPPGVTVPPGGVFTLRPGRGPSAYPDLLVTNLVTFGWGDVASPQTAAVVLYDAATNVVDAVCAGEARPRLLRGWQSVSIDEWWGSNTALSLRPGETLQRRGNVDTHQAADWLPGADSLGLPNRDLVAPFRPGFGAVALATNALPAFTGALTTEVRVLKAVPGTLLRAEAAFGASTSPLISAELPPADVLALPPIRLEVLASVREGDPKPTPALVLRMDQPSPTDISVQLTLLPADQAQVAQPLPLVIPAGQTRVTVEVEAKADRVLDGTQRVTVTVTADGYVVLPAALEVEDQEKARLTLELPEILDEGAHAEGFLVLDAAPALACRVQLAAQPSSNLQVSAELVVPAGSTRVPFPILAVEDREPSGLHRVNVLATGNGWSPAEGAVAIRDNDVPTAMLLLSEPVPEGSGLQKDVGLLRLGSTHSTNVVFTLISANPAEASGPATITVPAGESAVRFDLVLGENSRRDGRHAIALDAQAFGFPPARADLVILDNDPDRFVFDPIESPRSEGTPFLASLTAYDLEGRKLAGFAQARLGAEDDLGAPVAVTPATFVITNGLWVGKVSVGPSARPVRLVAETEAARGTSEGFNVLPLPQITEVALRTLDLAWDAPLGRLVATTAADDPQFPNRIVAIDPVTAIVSPIAEAGPFVAMAATNYAREGRISIAGRVLYVTSHGASRVQAFDLDSGARLRELPSAVPADDSLIADLHALADPAGTLLLARTRAGIAVGVTLYRGEFGTSDESLFATLLTEGDEPGRVFALIEPNPSVLFYADVPRFGPLKISSFGSAPSGFAWAAGDLKRVGDDVIKASGGAIAITSRTAGGTPEFAVGGLAVALDAPLEAGQGRVEFDPVRDRVFFLTRESSTDEVQWLQVFSRRGQRRIADFLLAGGIGDARRLVRAGDALAFNVADRLRLLRSPALNAPEPEVAVGFTWSQEPAPAVAGSPFDLVVAITNAGPSVATDVGLNLSLPEGFVPLSSTADAGSGGFRDGTAWWHLLSLKAGTSVRVRFRVNTPAAGVFTHGLELNSLERNSRGGSEPETVRSEVVIPTSPDTLAEVSLAAQHLVWDSRRGIFYAARGLGGLVALRPEDGSVVREWATGPLDALVLSDDQSALYFAESAPVPRLRQLQLDTGAFDSEIPLPSRATALLDRLGQVLVAVEGRPEILAYARGVGLPIRPPGASLSEFKPALSLAPGPLANRFYAVYETDYLTYRPGRFQLRADGVWPEASLATYSMGPVERPGAVQYARERLWTPGGHVLDPELGTLLGRLSVGTNDPGTQAVRVDDEVRRVYTLWKPVSAGATGVQLRAFDPDTFALIGERPLPTVRERPFDLLRWGTDGLSFLTTAGQWFLVRSSLVPVDAETDLAAHLEATRATGQSEDSVSLLLTAQNLGAVAAEEVVLSLRLPPELAFLSGSSSAGSVKADQQVVSCRIARLTPGERAQATVVVRPTSSGAATVIAAVASRARDPQPENDVARLTVIGALGLAIDATTTVSLQAVDLAIHPNPRRLIVAVASTDPHHSDEVVSLDPEWPTPDSILLKSTNLLQLAQSADRSLLYVLHDPGPQVGLVQWVDRIDLVGGIPPLSFPVTELQPNVAWIGRAVEIGVPPGQPRRLVIRTDLGKFGVFEDGRQVGDFVAGGTNFVFTGPEEFVTRLAVTSGTAEVMRMTSGAAGLDNLRWRLGDGPLFPGRLFQFGTRVLTGEGYVVDPGVDAIVGQWHATGLLAVAQDTHLATTLVASGNRLRLRTFAPTEFREVADEDLGPLPSSALQPQRLFRWGTNGLAYVAEGRLQLRRTSQIPVAAPADLALSWGDGAEPSLGSSALLTLTNRGPNEAANIRVRIASQPATVLQAVDGATLTATNGSVEVRLDSLPAAAFYQWRVSFASIETGRLGLLSAAVFSSAEDSRPADNRAGFVPGVHRPDPAGVLPLRGPFPEWRDFVADPVARRLYAATFDRVAQEGAVLGWDPWTGRFDKVLLFDLPPSKIARSADGRFLYASTETDQAVLRFRLPDLTPDLRIPLFGDGHSTSAYLDAMAAAPSREGNAFLAVSRQGRLSLFDGQALRSSHFEIGEGDLAFTDDGTRLWHAHDSVNLQSIWVDTWNLGPEGLLATGGFGFPRPAHSGQFVWHANRAYFAAGLVVDVMTRAEAGNFPADPWSSAVFVDPVGRRLGTTRGGTNQLALFDLDQLTPLAPIPVPFSAEAPRRMARWGADGIAMLTSTDLTMVRSSALQPPTGQDTDQDGMPDAWELDHGLDPFVGDAEGDPDADGRANLEEFRRGTDPLTAEARATRPTITVVSGRQLRFPTELGFQYQIESSPELPGTWSPAGAVIRGTGQPVVTEVPVPGTGAMFHRVRVIVP